MSAKFNGAGERLNPAEIFARAEAAIEKAKRFLAECDALTCPVCGLARCECPDPIGECRECHAPIFEGDRYAIDIEGDRYCIPCWGKLGGLASDSEVGWAGKHPTLRSDARRGA